MELNKSGNMEIKVLDNLSINQNVICWVLSYIGVAYAASHPELTGLGCLCRIMLVLCSISVGVSMLAYTIAYWKKKLYKSRHPELFAKK